MKRRILFLLILGLACSPRDERPIGQPSRVEGLGSLGVPFGSDQLTAYLRGRTGEVALLRSKAGAIAPGRLDSVGAGTAGLSIPAYRSLVDSVDRYLMGRSPRSHGARAEPQDSLLTLSDSLRAERLVLIVRLGN
jgi:hypothetical protein